MKAKTTLDVDTYVRVQEKFEPCQIEPLALFGRMDKLLAKLTPWICLLTLAYLSAQVLRAIYQGWM